MLRSHLRTHEKHIHVGSHSNIEYFVFFSCLIPRTICRVGAIVVLVELLHYFCSFFHLKLENCSFWCRFFFIFFCFQIVEPSQGETGELIAIIPIKVSVRGIFSKYKISPSHDLNFGSICSGARKQKFFTIENLGEFDFKYNITRPISKDEQIHLEKRWAVFYLKPRVAWKILIFWEVKNCQNLSYWSRKSRKNLVKISPSSSTNGNKNASSV